MNEATYLRTPLATAHYVDWWHVGGVHLLRRMDPQARYEWERLAKAVEIPAKEKIVPPAGHGTMIGVIETGRVRIALPAAKPEPVPTPALSHPSAHAKAVPEPPQAPPQSPLVIVGEAGDLFGVLSGGSKRRYGPQFETLEVETLRDSRIWFASEDVFRGFLWKRGEWTLPTPRSVWWRSEGPPSGRKPSFAWAKYQAAIGLAEVERVLPRDGVRLSALWGRTRNSRAALAMIELLRRGPETFGAEQRLRKRFSASEFAEWIGGDLPWTRYWLDYAKSEGVIRKRWGRWVVKQQWRLHQWADASMMEQTFALPPNPYEQYVEPDVSVGRPSRTAEGTTPSGAAASGESGQAY